jgi:hypothetical protein
VPYKQVIGDAEILDISGIYWFSNVLTAVMIEKFEFLKCFDLRAGLQLKFNTVTLAVVAEKRKPGFPAQGR